MAGKTIRVPCTTENCALLCRVMRRYADAAFPPGASECAQASREQLLTLAERFAQQQRLTGEIELASRQRGMLRGAIKGYFEHLSGGAADLRKNQKEELLALLKRNRD